MTIQSPIAKTMTPQQARTVAALLDALENGSVFSTYARVAAVPGEKGALSYGRVSATLANGDLTNLIARYTSETGALLAKPLSLLAPTLRDRNVALHADLYFHNLLRAAADDPLMRDIQDRMFDERFVEPALRIARRTRIQTPLGLAILIDSKMQSGWETISRRINKKNGKAPEMGETKWLKLYVDERFRWLTTHRTKAKREAGWRAGVFQDLIRLGNWDLRLPIVIRGEEIDADRLDAAPDGTYDGPSPRARVIGLTRPLTRGRDVRLLQLALSGLTVGRGVKADGIYGPLTAEAIRSLQDTLGFTPTGTVEARDFDMLKM